MPEEPQNQVTPANAGPFEDLLEPGEHMLVIVRKHPIGLIIIFLQALVGIAALIALAIFIAPDVFNDLSTQAHRAIVAGAFSAGVIILLVLFVASYVYRQSRLLVTDKSLIQILQKSLFSRSVSRLSMSNVEDVTSDEKGLLATVFNYGTLTVETAGEKDNFIFPNCPDPNKYAHRILEARQAYAQSVEEGAER